MKTVIIAKFFLRGLGYVFTEGGNSRGGLSIGFGLSPLGMQWVSVPW